MVVLARKRATYAEYLAIANDSAVKYEFMAGEIVAMAGGTIALGRLIGRASDLLNRALDGKPCLVLRRPARIGRRLTRIPSYFDAHVS